MKNQDKYLFFLLFAPIVIIGFLSCQKKTSIQDHNTFIKTYETDSMGTGVGVSQLADGGFIIVSSEGAGRPVLLRTDKYGNLKWKKTINNYCFSTAGNFNVLELKDGLHYLLQARDQFTIIDTNGTISASKNLATGANFNLGLISDNDPDFLFSACDGSANGNSTNNLIYTLDQNLNQANLFSFPDSYLGGKTFWFSTLSKPISNNYIIAGVKLPRKNWTFRDVIKIFAAKITQSGLIKETMIDTGDLRHSDEITWLIPTKDSGMVLLGVRTDIATSVYYPLIIRLDKNLDVSWKKEFPLVNSFIWPQGISNCNDDGFLMYGQLTTIAGGENNQSEYIMKIDKNGIRQWEKSFPGPGSGNFYHCKNLTDGGFTLVGNSNGFAKSKTGFKILFVKTDKDGNY